MKHFWNKDEIINTRDIMARLAALESDSVDSAERRTLRDLIEQAEGKVEDWEYGIMVRDSHFVAYTRDLAIDVGAFRENNRWPYYCIDWDAAADEIRIHYTPVNFDGVKYWIK
jgi:hypothetical protein